MNRWTRSDTLAMALDSCTSCRGTGILVNSRAKMRPCNCVLRSIFRVCYNRFMQCSLKEKHMTKATLETGAGGNSQTYRWSRKDEEFVADFYLVSKRTLDPQEWDIFRFHFLLGADWRLCCRRLNMDRGQFFHSVYRIEQKLGRTFKELEPYALFPVDQYFGGYAVQSDWNEPLNIDFETEDKDKPGAKVIPIRPPVKTKPGETEADKFDLPEERAA